MNGKQKRLMFQGCHACKPSQISTHNVQGNKHDKVPNRSQKRIFNTTMDSEENDKSAVAMLSFNSSPALGYLGQNVINIYLAF